MNLGEHRLFSFALDAPGQARLVDHRELVQAGGDLFVFVERLELEVKLVVLRPQDLRPARHVVAGRGRGEVLDVHRHADCAFAGLEVGSPSAPWRLSPSAAIVHVRLLTETLSFSSLRI